MMGTYFGACGSEEDPQKSLTKPLNPVSSGESGWKTIVSNRRGNSKENDPPNLRENNQMGVSMDIDDNEKAKEAKEELFYDEKLLARTEFEKLIMKRSALTEDASVDEIVEAFVDCPVELTNEEKEKLIGRVQAAGNLIEIFGTLKDAMKCPYCNGVLNKMRGVQLERLKCKLHGPLGRFDLVGQIPREIFKAYLEKGGNDRRKEWIEEFNALSEDESDEMDIIECFQNGKNEQTEIKNEKNEIKNEKNELKNEKNELKNEKKMEKNEKITEKKDNELKENEMKINQVEKSKPIAAEKVIEKTSMRNSEEDNRMDITEENLSSNPTAKVTNDKGLEVFIDENADKIMFPSVEIAANQMASLTTLEKIAIDKPLKEVIWHLLNVNGKIAEKLRIEGYSKMEKETLNGTSGNKISGKGIGSNSMTFEDALKEGIKKKELSRGEIKKICAYTYNPKKVEAYATIHFKGIRGCDYSLVWKTFEQFNIDKRRVKHLQFVDHETLEIILFEDYVEEITNILENAHKKKDFNDLIIKRIPYDPLDPMNIMDPAKRKDVREIFRQRLQRKIENIARLKVKAPHLTRVENYVRKQLQCMSLNIVMRVPLCYDETVSAQIEKQINVQTTNQTRNEIPKEQNEMAEENRINNIEITNCKVDLMEIEVVSAGKEDIQNEPRN